MSDYVIMPQSDYIAACDAVREKIGSSALLRSNELGQAISSIQTSGDTTMMDYVSGENYDLALPMGTQAIKDYAFYKDANMTSLSLPATITSIGVEAFRECRQIESATIPASVTSIGYRAFSYDIGLTEVVFLGTPDSIANNAFLNSNVEDIYVPWAERAVANAPWGAVSATIYYESEV